MFTNPKHSAAVEVQLAGGLGNQLFQVFAGFSRARKLGCPLWVIAPQNIERDTPRKYELAFLEERIGMTRVSSPSAKKAFIERSSRFDPRISRVKAGTLLRGFFQSWKYFDGVDVGPLVSSNDVFSAGKAAVGLDKFITVHLRRGDYEIEPARTFHGLFSAEYFRAAVSLVRTQIGDLPVVIFSDCVKCGTYLSKTIDNASLFSANNSSALFTLGAMNGGAAYVLSNSSLSWWAAYTEMEKRPLVIAPQPWFRRHDYSSQDLLPDSWQPLPDPRPVKENGALQRSHMEATG